MSRHPDPEPGTVLRRGWTTGACAAAATKAAYQALLCGEFPDPVSLQLPRGQQPAFALARQRLDIAGATRSAMAGIIKDAGDDPDVTHGALVIARVRALPDTAGVRFVAGPGVGTVTKPGLPLAVGEPAINPVPRELMRGAIAELATRFASPGAVEIEISIPGGAALARQTWNPRLGIVGGLSILGTTGVVVPYSCSAWIHSIHRGVDVARASGLSHVAGCTGSTSEQVVQALYQLPDIALLDMGDFAGGLLKYLRRHPLSRLTIGGGFGKLSKLAAGHLDLHSGRSQVDMNWLAQQLREVGGDASLAQRAGEAHSAAAVLQLARQYDLGAALATRIAELAADTACALLGDVGVSVDVVVVDRGGQVAGRYSPA